MKAIIQDRYGTPEDLRLGEVPRPEPGEDDVLVRVRAASMHPDVWHVVTGTPRVLRIMGGGFRRPRNPVPGTDMAGVVEAVGASVRRFKPGDAVFGETVGFQWANGGAFAEYAAAKASWLAPMPPEASFEAAASVPTAGFIVLLNFRELGRLEPGTRVLVNGAGGGVGSIALQLAKGRGAHVTAVDTTGKLELLRRLGADDVVDFTAEDFTARGARYDIIFDVPGDRPFAELRRALEPDGRYIPIGHDHYGRAGRSVFGLIPHFMGLMARGRFNRQLRGTGLPAPTRPEAMETLRRALEDGTLTPPVDSTWPLEEVTAAMRHMMNDELHGKVILTVP